MRTVNPRDNSVGYNRVLNTVQPYEGESSTVSHLVVEDGPQGRIGHSQVRVDR